MQDDVLCRVDVEATQRPAASRRLRAEEEVPPDRHERTHREVLVDGGDSARPRLPRRVEDRVFAVEDIPALVGSVDTREDLDEGRLAGPVVAEDAHDLAAV